MTWLVVIALALAAFAVAVLVFRLRRATWSSLLAALAFGLAGYAIQASPGMEGAPRSASQDDAGDEWQVVDTRKALLGTDYNSSDQAILLADAYARRGDFAQAADFLSGAVEENPENFEAWLALGIALTEQADGYLTQASVYSFTQAAQLRPSSPAPNYFLGLSLIRQGRMMEARQVWRSALDQADPQSDAAQFVRERLERLDSMLVQAGAVPLPESE